MIVCGGLHNIALNHQGRVFTWGRGEAGQLGLGNIERFDKADSDSIFINQPKEVKSLANINIS